MFFKKYRTDWKTNERADWTFGGALRPPRHRAQHLRPAARLRLDRAQQLLAAGPAQLHAGRVVSVDRGPISGSSHCLSGPLQTNEELLLFFFKAGQWYDADGPSGEGVVPLPPGKRS